ncbi:MAG TPA: OmpA family protein [Stellaceae bacterium]|nr:OmpA family protein [Stellaceae bacterium]
MARPGIFAGALGACVFAAAAAHGQGAIEYSGQTRGWYVGFEVGWSDLQSFDSAGGPGHIQFHAAPDTGFGGGGVGGYNFGRVRFEGELVFRRQGVKSLNVNAGSVSFPGLSGGVSPEGNITSLAIMANTIVDILPNHNWTPYVGAGVGGARIALDDLQVSHTNFVNKSDKEFAYQGIVGVRYQVAERLSLDLDYRYFATSDPSFKDLGGFRFKTTYATHNAMLGLTYHFPSRRPSPVVPAVAPPPTPAAAAPPQAPPPPEVRMYLVFFDFDRSALTPAGQRVVEEAATTFKQASAVRIAVTGYTDLAGSAQYNLGLSKRRADTVHLALVKLGVPNAAIVEAWHGKENPRVPTPDGVREAQNRRVEIVIP